MQYINAYNIHRGGGASLLKEILKLNFNEKVLIFVDIRFSIKNLKIGHNVNIEYIKPNLFSRFFLELKLTRLIQKDDYLLCFGNLPPLFKTKGYLSVFIQNRLLVEKVSLHNFSFAHKIRILIERIWVKLLIRRAKKIFVQSLSMQFLVQKLSRNSDIVIAPFCTTSGFNFFKAKKFFKHKNYFLYVATGEPHKNHLTLIEAWIILSKEKIFPKLILTLDKTTDSKLIKKIESLKTKHHLQVENLGFIESIDFIYKNAKALIYPSTIESFGLPIVEASIHNLPIIASELDFVRDIIDPHETFNPLSALSISRAVKRFLSIKGNRHKLVDASFFVESQKK